MRLSRMPTSVVTPSVVTPNGPKTGNVPAEKRPGMTIQGMPLNELRDSVVTSSEMKLLVRIVRVTGNESSHHAIQTNDQTSQVSGKLPSVVTPSVVTPSGTSLNGTRLNEKAAGRLTKHLVIRRTDRENPDNAVMPSVETLNGAIIKIKTHNAREKIVNNGMSRAKLINGTQLRVTNLNGRLPSVEMLNVMTPNGETLNGVMFNVTISSAETSSETKVNVMTSSVETPNENRNPCRSSGNKIGNGVLNGKGLCVKVARPLRSTRTIPSLP
jgi:hypothetical protein